MRLSFVNTPWNLTWGCGNIFLSAETFDLCVETHWLAQKFNHSVHKSNHSAHKLIHSARKLITVCANLFTVICIKKFRWRFHKMLFANDCQDQGYNLLWRTSQHITPFGTQKHGQTPFEKSHLNFFMQTTVAVLK